MKKLRWRRRFKPRPLTLRRKFGFAAIAALPVLAIFTFGNRGILKRVELQIEVDNLYQQLYRERSSGDSLRAAIKQLEGNDQAIERLARERYGMVRPGETIYRVPE
jgi:cell division protein FtsB